MTTPNKRYKALLNARNWPKTDINVEYIGIEKDGLIGSYSGDDDDFCKVRLFNERIQSHSLISKKAARIFARQTDSMPMPILFEAVIDGNKIPHSRAAHFITTNFQSLFLFVCRMTLGLKRTKVYSDKAFLDIIFVRDGNLFLAKDNLFKDREDKAESAPSFLRRVYKDALSDDILSLSDLRRIDESLWRGLRNWAHAGGHNLDDIIPRGKTTPGPARHDLGFDPTTLDASDPIQAAALRLAQQRAAGREAAAKSYARRRKPQPS